ncbi:unnamed protein product [Tilletia laevis]|nr:hypothetical protein CF335_g4169 [Tilletia laevis]CAD6893661.1 unnamed protein product [Tilletia caries]CAD6959884.1 unnamed protein product [Tilletia laevis]CAD6977874.1 unnamed protein product [Tilletia controversa]
MHFKLLLSLIALTSSAIAVTTGPYNVGSGHLTEVPSNIFAQQGQVNTVVNQTIGCDVAGPGLNLAGAPFQFQASSALPSRANDSSIYYFGRTEDRYQYWAGQLAAVPSRRFVFQRDQFTFSLSAAGKTANVTCSAGARRQNFGVANIASLPIWTQLARFAIVAVRNETLGTPPLNSTSLVSSYRPLCNFAGIGTQDFEISLGGFKSNLS